MRTVRSLAKTPGFTATAVVTLALGIGASTAIFSVVDAIVLRPLPYRDAERLVTVWDQLNNLGLTRFASKHAHYLDYREQNRVFDDIAAFDFFDANLPGAAGDAERLTGMRATANLFPLVGARAYLGRVFTEAEPQDSVLLSFGLWQRRFGGDMGVIGRGVRLNDAVYQIAGVMPRDYSWPIATSTPPDIWTPLVVRPDPARSLGGLRLIARMKNGVTIEQAQADMKAVARKVDAHRPYRGPQGQDPGYNVAVVGLREEIYGTLPSSVLLLLGAVGLVLAIACANVAHLLLARGAARAKEMAVRRALGAGDARIAGQFLAESILLSIGGCALGLLFASWGIATLTAIGPERLFRAGTIAIDERVLAFSVVVSLITGLAFGLIPALRGRHADLTESLKSARSTSERSTRRSAEIIVAAQVALSLVLLTGAGLLIRSFLKLLDTSPGFHPENVLSLRISLPMNRYGEPHQREAFFENLLERVRLLPGITASGVVSRLPLSGVGRGGDPFSIEGRAWRSGGAIPQFANYQAASPEYFRAMGIPLLKGRFFTDRDSRVAEPVVVINETLARGFFAGEEPLGKRILVGAPTPGARWMTIIGVVGDVRNSGLEVDPIPQMYQPYAQQPIWSVWLVARTPADPMSALTSIRRQVAAVDPDQPVYDVRTMEERVGSAVSQPKFQGVLMGVFALVALALASVGLYGVVAHSVARRTQEIGVRMSLGARPADVLALVVRQGMRPVVAGAVVGAAGAFAVANGLKAFLFNVSPTDPATFLGVAMVLVAVSLAACWLPARRASRVDPLIALRND